MIELSWRIIFELYTFAVKHLCQRRSHALILAPAYALNNICAAQIVAVWSAISIGLGTDT